MKVKKNNLLGLAVLVPFLILAGCGDTITNEGATTNNSSEDCPTCPSPSSVLTVAQKEALADITAQEIIVGIDATSNATSNSVQYLYVGENYTPLVGFSANTQSSVAGVIVQKPGTAANNNLGVVGLTGPNANSKIKAGSTLTVSDGMLFYEADATDTNGAEIFAAAAADDDSVKLGTVQLDEYTLRLPITIQITPENESAMLTVQAELNYDYGEPSSTGCLSPASDTLQSKRLQISDGTTTDVYAAISSDGKLLICQ